MALPDFWADWRTFNFLKSDQKKKQKCFFAGLDSHPSGWDGKVRQAFQVSLQSGLVAPQGIQGPGVQEEEPRLRPWEGGLISSNPSPKSGPPASIPDSSVSSL